MVNQPHPPDVEQLKTIGNFNSYIARIWVDRLMRQLLRGLYGNEPSSFLAKNKGQLKDFIVDHPILSNRRIEEMIARYRKFPEDFYRETPLDGRIYYHAVNGQPILDWR